MYLYALGSCTHSSFSSLIFTISFLCTSISCSVVFTHYLHCFFSFHLRTHCFFSQWTRRCLDGGVPCPSCRWRFPCQLLENDVDSPCNLHSVLLAPTQNIFSPLSLSLRSTVMMMIRHTFRPTVQQCCGRDPCTADQCKDTSLRWSRHSRMPPVRAPVLWSRITETRSTS